MANLVIALGSESKLKIAAVTKTLQGLGVENFELRTYKAASGVGDQPEGFYSTFDGAFTRAWSALEAIPEATIGIGLESGLVHASEVSGYFDTAVAVIIDRASRKSHYGFGPGFPIPDWAIQEARQSELGDVVMRRGAKDKNPMAYFSEGEVDRTEILAWAVRCALMSYRHEKRYAEH